MGNCIIFCAADFHGLVAPLAKDDFIIAADGGLAHVEKLGIAPNGILGDFDSLGYTPEGSTVFPVERMTQMLCWPSEKDWSWVIEPFIFMAA